MLTTVTENGQKFVSITDLKNLLEEASDAVAIAGLAGLADEVVAASALKSYQAVIKVLDRHTTT